VSLPVQPRPAVSPLTELLYAGLGPALARDDAGQWLWLSLLDALTLPLQEADALARRTDLYDVDACPDRWLPWLAMYAGVTYLPGLPASANRMRIKARVGSTAGTPAELVAAVRAVLAGGGGVVRLLERDTGPHHATVQTYAGQTPDLAAARAAIAATKPDRVIVDLQVLPSASYAEVRAAKPGQTYADRQARFPTYGDVTTYIPGA
jgi:hypothetical protein